MNLHQHQLYLFDHQSESIDIWSAIIRISTEGESLIMKVGPASINTAFSINSGLLSSYKWQLNKT